MRCGVLPKLLLACVGLPLFAGCTLPRLNEGRAFAIYSAGYAGRYHIAYARWPNLNELEEYVCMRGCADGFVGKPYRTQMAARAAYLEMRFFDLAMKPVCSLKVLTPPPRSEEELFPMIVIKTSLLSCPGNGKRAVE